MTNGPHFIVKTPNQFYSGDRLGVHFNNGVGRTRSIEKAKRFDDEFGYVVTLPPGIEPWTLKRVNPMQNRAEEYPQESSTPVVDEID